MSQVDEFVREKILAHPTSYSNRTEVLHNVLCVFHSGYRWTEDGSIVAVNDTPVAHWSKERELERVECLLDEIFAAIDTSSNFSRDSLRADFIEPIERAEKIVQEIDIRVHTKGKIAVFYPQDEWSLLMTVPNNVTDDWREACDEMRALASKAGWVFS